MDAAFGSDYDVPILVLPKAPSKEKSEVKPESVDATEVKEHKVEAPLAEEKDVAVEDKQAESPS